MGPLEIGVRSLLEGIGLEVILPPKPSKRSLNLGVKYAPEFACLPLKVTLGNFIEALEKGADFILMAGSHGPCRFGYYGVIQEALLRSLGYDFRMLILDQRPDDFFSQLKKLSNVSWTKLTREVLFAWRKLRALETIQEIVQKRAPHEKKRGETKKVYLKGVSSIERAETGRELKRALKRSKKALLAVECVEKPTSLRVGIVGEIYMTLEPFCNFDLEEKLFRLGIEVDRSVWLSGWILHCLRLEYLGQRPRDKVVKQARPYLKCTIGGEGLESVGNSVLYARRGYDGIIHVMPFTCMPEVSAKIIMGKISKDYNIPILTLIIDEQTAPPAVQTRLEAFVDLLYERRRKRM